VNTPDDSEAIIKGNENGYVKLYYDGSEKLATTATGIDVTGSVTCDGFTSTGIDDNATSTAITIDASENVGIGTASPSEKLHVVGGQLKITGAAGGGAGGGFLSGEVSSEFHIRSQDYTGSTHADIVFDSGNGSTFLERMRINSAGNVEVATGNLVIGTSGKGIDFSAVSDGSRSVSSNLLDDYEEGTWTPTFTGAHSLCSGTYTKIGNVVSVYAYVRCNGTATNTFGGLPFEPLTGNNTGIGSAGIVGGQEGTGSTLVTGDAVRVSAGASFHTNNAWNTALTLGAYATFVFSATYRV
jgi:hypothetical protein